MRKLGVVACLLIAAQLSACATKSLWDSTSADKYVRVRADRNSEDEAKGNGLAYFKSDDGKSLYVQKTAGDRCRDYAVRLVGTPFTLVIDAVGTVLFIGTLGLVAVVTTLTDGDVSREGRCKGLAQCKEPPHEDDFAPQK